MEAEGLVEPGHVVVGRREERDVGTAATGVLDDRAGVRGRRDAATPLVGQRADADDLGDVAGQDMLATPTGRSSM